MNDRVRPFVMTGGRVKADRRDLRVHFPYEVACGCEAQSALADLVALRTF